MRHYDCQIDVLQHSTALFLLYFLFCLSMCRRQGDRRDNLPRQPRRRPVAVIRCHSGGFSLARPVTRPTAHAPDLRVLS
jgi:hypothetical protein